MLAFIALLGGSIDCVLYPYEANKVHNGWMRRNFKGSPAEWRSN